MLNCGASWQAFENMSSLCLDKQFTLSVIFFLKPTFFYVVSCSLYWHIYCVEVLKNTHMICNKYEPGVVLKQDLFSEKKVTKFKPKAWQELTFQQPANKRDTTPAFA